MSRPAKWIIDGSYVRSSYDGQRHYVSAGQVARLHGLSDGEWVRRIGDQEPHLFPRCDGHYRDLCGVTPPAIRDEE